MRELSATKQEIKALREAALKSKEGSLPDQWYQHPQAYTLDPSYQKAVSENSTLRSYEQYYTDQLIKIKKGEDAEDLIAGPGGQLQKYPIKATTEAEIAFERKLAFIQQRIHQNDISAQNLRATFASRVQQAQSGIKQVEDAFFPQYKDKADILTTDPYMKEVMDQLRKTSLDGDLLAPLVAKMYSAVETLHAENQKLKAEAAKASKLTQIQQQAGPTSAAALGQDTTKPTSGGKQLVTDVVDAFENYKKEHSSY